ncbi:MAG TPA: hypothetical protein VFT22_36440 [Kofleriaceae bacterium]|nr:hypothetical protein [Kofleriaceae bacterium]
MSQVVSRSESKARFGKLPAMAPTTYWTTVANVDPGWTWIVVPVAGKLWVYCDAAEKPEQFYVWHQGGNTTSINSGDNYVVVAANDMIKYQISKTPSGEIKFAYQLTPAA